MCQYWKEIEVPDGTTQEACVRFSKTAPGCDDCDYNTDVYDRSNILFTRLLKLPVHQQMNIMSGLYGWMHMKFREKDMDWLENAIKQRENYGKETMDGA